MSRHEDAIMSSNSLVPRERATDDLTPGLIQIGRYQARVRRHWGVGAPRWLFDVMDTGPHGQLVRVATYCSHPSEADCANAINQHRAGRSVARVVDEASARATAEMERFARSPLGAPTVPDHPGPTRRKAGAR